MTASINLQLSMSDCVSFENMAKFIKYDCEANYKLPVTQLFNGASIPPSQPILTCSSNNHDVFNLSFYSGKRIEWKVKVRSVSVNGAIKYTHYAVLNPTSLRLADAQITDFRQIPWQIDLVEYTSPVGSPALDTTTMNLTAPAHDTRHERATASSSSR